MSEYTSRKKEIITSAQIATELFLIIQSVEKAFDPNDSKYTKEELIEKLYNLNYVRYKDYGTFCYATSKLFKSREIYDLYSVGEDYRTNIIKTLKDGVEL